MRPASARPDGASRINVATSPSRVPLVIEWRESDDHVIMTGPAEWEWSGTLDPATGACARDAETIAS